jgi:Fe-S-cluster-containing hydrogenase component 2
MRLNIDPTTCTGCRLCEVYCSITHENDVNPALSRIKVWKDEVNGLFLPIACTLCDDKECLSACPEPGAIALTKQGTVVINEELCTGCSKCVRACEILAITFHAIPGRGKNGKAVVVKCNLCDGDPVCVKVCEPGTISLIEDDDGGGQPLYEALAEQLHGLETMRVERGFKVQRRIP